MPDMLVNYFIDLTYIYFCFSIKFHIFHHFLITPYLKVASQAPLGFKHCHLSGKPGLYFIKIKGSFFEGPHGHYSPLKPFSLFIGEFHLFGFYLWPGPETCMPWSFTAEIPIYRACRCPA